MESKFLYARQLAAALAYIGLNNTDKVVIYGVSDQLRMLLEPSHGRAKILPMLQTLQDAEVYGSGSDFEGCARSFQVRHKRKGLVIPISDFLFPDGFEAGLKFLQWHKHEVFCMQVLDEHDLKCDLRGDVELECIESGSRLKVTITPSQAAEYEKALAQWNQSLARTCARRGMGLAITTTERPFDEVIQKILRKGGLIA